MTPREIAEKYVYGRHNALTDAQEVEDMVKDIESLSLPSAMVSREYVSISPCGYDEVHDIWYKCSNCGSEYILESMKYCPDCGGKLHIQNK